MSNHFLPRLCPFLLLLGLTFLDTHEPERARQAFEELVASFPDSEQAASARAELADL